MSTLISGLDDAELKHMFKFAVERQRMYNRWSACKKVSKKDILRTGKLSNVHRYLDRETVYVLSSIIQPMLAEEYTKGDLLFNLLMFRVFINRGDIFKTIGLQRSASFNAKEWASSREMLTAKKVFGVMSSNAYIIPAFKEFKEFGDGPGSKVWRAAAMFVEVAEEAEDIWTKLEEGRPNSKRTFALISGIKGVGPFAAYQTCLDIGYFAPHIFDQNSFVYAGPGAVGGLEVLSGSKPNERRAVELITSIRDQQAALFDAAGISEEKRERAYSTILLPPGCTTAAPFTLHEIQGLLCEYKKIHRAKTGGGYDRKGTGKVLFKTLWKRRGPNADGYAASYKVSSSMMSTVWQSSPPPAAEPAESTLQQEIQQAVTTYGCLPGDMVCTSNDFMQLLSDKEGKDFDLLYDPCAIRNSPSSSVGSGSRVRSRRCRRHT